MKKINLLLIISFTVCILISGCKNEDTVQESTAKEPAAEPITVETVTPEATPVVTQVSEAAVPEDTAEAVPEESGTVEDDAEADSSSDNTGTDTESDAADSEKTEDADNGSAGKTGRTIVWLGDSLTQGSLGDDNDNLAHAPYVKLQSLVANKVEGYGLYGYKTHDIFWVYRDEGHYDQRVDPNKIYIFWVGSNDWCPDDSENTNTAPVIAEIDNFLSAGPVKDYIVIGTTQRWRLGIERARIINADLQAKYGSHYIDVVDIIEANGFAPDNTHLSQASYDAIAVAVHNKLKALGYI